jgi:hypothetical protein
MATNRTSSLGRIRYRPVGRGGSLMEGRVAGPASELPVSGPVHTAVTIAEKATLAQEAMVQNAQDTHATAPVPAMNQRQRQRRGFGGASVSATPGQNSILRPSC